MRGRALRMVLIAAAVMLVAGGAILVKVQMMASNVTPQNDTGGAVDPQAAVDARLKMQVEAALEETRRGVAAEPANPDAHFRLAQAYAMSSDLENAIGSLKRCLELNPKYIEAHLVLGQIYQDLGYFDRAHDHLQSALDLEPNRLSALVAMGRMFFRFADGYAAMPYLQRAAQLTPPEPDLQAEIEMDLTLAYFLQGDFKTAQSHIEKAVQLQPDNPLALQRLGVLYYSVNQFGEARETLERVLTISREPEAQIDARKSLAKVELRDPKGSAETAQGWLQQLEQGGYTDSEVQFLLGEVARRMNRPQDAVQRYEAAVQGDAPYPDAYRPLAEVYREVGRTADAEALKGRESASTEASAALRDLTARLARNPKQPELWLRLAEHLHGQGLDGYAIFYLRRGLVFNPGNARLHRALADRYAAAGRGADAERERAAAH